MWLPRYLCRKNQDDSTYLPPRKINSKVDPALEIYQERSQTSCNFCFFGKVLTSSLSKLSKVKLPGSKQPPLDAVHFSQRIVQSLEHFWNAFSTTLHCSHSDFPFIGIVSFFARNSTILKSHIKQLTVACNLGDEYR